LAVSFSAIDCARDLAVPDKNGKCEDIVLGCNDAAEYEAHSSYFGAIVGRVANRIRDGKFTLNGKSYELAQNNGGNALHGGEEGYDKKHWSCKEIPNGVQLSLTRYNPSTPRHLALFAIGMSCVADS
jgi:aldose 1-epimerase